MATAARPSRGQEPIKGGAVRARHVEDLRPACRPGHQGDRVRPDTESLGHRGQCGRRRLAIHRPGADPHHQRAIMLAADSGADRPGPDPDRDPHPFSVHQGAGQPTAPAPAWPGT